MSTSLPPLVNCHSLMGTKPTLGSCFCVVAVGGGSGTRLPVRTEMHGPPQESVCVARVSWLASQDFLDCGERQKRDKPFIVIHTQPKDSLYQIVSDMEGGL